MSYRPLVAAFCMIAWCRFVGAAGAPPATSPAAFPATDPLPLPAAGNVPSDPRAAETIVDPFISGQMGRWHVPGAVFVLVRDGRVVLAKGYGWADLENRVPFDPGASVVPVGSLSKIVTAVAVMQQVEAGKIDLGADVNRALEAGGAPFRLEEAFAGPVTAGHLLTHTAGLEDTHIGMAARTPEMVMPLGRYLAERRPRRVWPAGEIASYCNDGYALAGYLVELASGEPFERYARRHVFDPLGMARSTFGQPPETLAGGPATAETSAARPPARAVGYAWRKGRHVPLPPLSVHDVPTAAMTTTAADMARFLVELLKEGRRGGRVLGPGAARELFQPHFSNSPHTSGWTYSFHDSPQHGQRRLEHGGMSIGFIGKVVLLPDENAGFFASYNVCEGMLLVELNSLFLPPGGEPAPLSSAAIPALGSASPPSAQSPRAQPLAPTLPPALPMAAPSSASSTSPAAGPDAAAPGHFEAYLGDYRPLGYAHSTMEKLDTLIRHVNVSPSPDGRGLTMKKFGRIMPLVEAGPGWFRCADLAASVEFRRQKNAGGPAPGATLLFYGTDAYERVPWHQTAPAQFTLAAAFALVFLPSCFLRPLGRPTEQSPPAARRIARAATWLARSASALNLLFLVGVGACFAGIDYTEYLYGLPGPVVALLMLPIASAALTLGLLATAALCWRRRVASPARRLRFTLLALTSAAFAAFLFHWNLLGPAAFAP